MDRTRDSPQARPRARDQRRRPMRCPYPLYCLLVVPQSPFFSPTPDGIPGSSPLHCPTEAFRVGAGVCVTPAIHSLCSEVASSKLGWWPSAPLLGKRRTRRRLLRCVAACRPVTALTIDCYPGLCLLAAPVTLALGTVCVSSSVQFVSATYIYLISNIARAAYASGSVALSAYFYTLLKVDKPKWP